MRVTGDQGQTDALVTALHGLAHVRSVEQIADQMRGVRDDSSSNALIDDTGADLYCVEVGVSGQRNVDEVQAMAEQSAREQGVIVEFVDEF
jgi:hypothetical protein